MKHLPTLDGLAGLLPVTLTLALSLSVGCAQARIDPTDLETPPVGAVEMSIDSLAVRGAPAGLRCGTRLVDEAERAEVEREVDAHARRMEGRRARQARGPATIPVYFHVIEGAGRQGKISKRQIKKQLNVLNKSFGGSTGGAETSYRFKLKKITRTKNPTWFSNCDLPHVESAMKSQLRRGGEDALNVYTCAPTGGLLGWATFPFDYTSAPKLDGVVLASHTVPGVAPGHAYDEGDVGVHEVGHWMGLFHTFQGGCQGKGDRVRDTPAQAGPVYGCPRSSDTCAGGKADALDNFMGYADNACMDSFTSGQAKRLGKLMARYR